MNREWKRGDVAMVEVGCWANRHVGIFTGSGWRYADDKWVADDPAIVTARPLVVIDPEDHEIVAKFAAWTADGDYADWRVEWVQNFLRSLVANPKPEEPTDPKVRVGDRRENIWRLLADGDWVCTSGPDIGEYLDWAHLTQRGPLSVTIA